MKGDGKWLAGWLAVRLFSFSATHILFQDKRVFHFICVQHTIFATLYFVCGSFESTTVILRVLLTSLSHSNWLSCSRDNLKSFYFTILWISVILFAAFFRIFLILWYKTCMGVWCVMCIGKWYKQFSSWIFIFNPQKKCVFGSASVVSQRKMTLSR